jgi:hypothetical protein
LTVTYLASPQANWLSAVGLRLQSTAATPSMKQRMLFQHAFCAKGSLADERDKPYGAILRVLETHYDDV